MKILTDEEYNILTHSDWDTFIEPDTEEFEARMRALTATAPTTATIQVTPDSPGVVMFELDRFNLIDHDLVNTHHMTAEIGMSNQTRFVHEVALVPLRAPDRTESEVNVSQLPDFDFCPRCGGWGNQPICPVCGEISKENHE